MAHIDVDPDTRQRMQAAAELHDRHHTVITNALHCHAQAMDEAATQAADAHAAGADTPLMTNHGFKMAAEVLADTARKEREAAHLIDTWKDGE
jgi:hypothetical protein